MQVSPPEHVSFPPMNDMSPMSLQGLPPGALEKMKKGKRKRKGEMTDAGQMEHGGAHSSSDEPPLKIVPHPVKYSSAVDTCDSDLKVFDFLVFLLCRVQEK